MLFRSAASLYVELMITEDQLERLRKKRQVLARSKDAPAVESPEEAPGNTTPSTATSSTVVQTTSMAESFDVDDVDEKYELQKKAIDLEKEFGMSVDYLARQETKFRLEFDDADWFAGLDPHVQMVDLEKMIEERTTWMEQVKQHLAIETPEECAQREEEEAAALAEAKAKSEKLLCTIEDVSGRLATFIKDQTDRITFEDGGKQLVQQASGLCSRLHPAITTGAGLAKYSGGVTT